MTSHETALDPPELSRSKWRQHAVTAGRIGLAVALLSAWKLGADAAGPVYAADPAEVLQRIVGDTLSGSLLRHIYVTLRLWSLGRKTIVFVTHDIAEAIALGDRTLVLSKPPARIAGEHANTIPRPRDVSGIMTHPDFAALYQRIRVQVQ